MISSRINLPDQASGLWSCAELVWIVPCPDRQRLILHAVMQDTQCLKTSADPHFSLILNIWHFDLSLLENTHVTNSNKGDNNDMGFFIKPTKLQICWNCSVGHGGAYLSGYIHLILSCQTQVWLTMLLLHATCCNNC